MRPLLLKVLLIPLAMPLLPRVMPLPPLAMPLLPLAKLPLLLLKVPLRPKRLLQKLPSSNRLLTANGSVWGRSFLPSLRDEGH